MKVLSIDVGIKNLAFCLFCRNDNESEYFTIKKWNIVNISEQETFTCNEIVKNSICNKPAKFMKDSKCFCLKHSKKQCYQIPTSELKPAFINKQKLQKLYELADKYKIKYVSPIKKQELINIINEYIYNTCFQPITNVNSSKVDLITVGKNIKLKFDEIFEEEGIIHKIIIENQISPIANRMKTIQGMISQYFIMKNNYQTIEFVSSINKLKETNSLLNNDDNSITSFNKDNDANKIKYSDRKKTGVTKCLEIITKQFEYNEWESYFIKHKKKDDLADSFLQGLWYIKTKL